MYYQADWLLTLDAPPLPGGWLRVAGDRLAAIGTPAELPSGAEVTRFSGCALLPGLINLHAHLELTSLQGRLPAGIAFSAWVRALRAATAGYTHDDYLDAARHGIAQLLRGGCTSVVDVGNTGAALQALTESPLRAWPLVEVLGLNPAAAMEKMQAAQALIDGLRPAPLQSPGVAAHSAYACSRELLLAVADDQRRRGQPFSLHAAESGEERDLFASGAGGLREFCRSIYPQAPAHHHTSALQYLDDIGMKPNRPLIIHANYATEDDTQWLARVEATVVHCPGSHAFFVHAPFPWEHLRRHGIPVCLGTDSLASGDSLSMLDQLRAFHRKFPVTAEEAIRMATVYAARALGRSRDLGILVPGYQADFIAVTARASPYEAVLQEEAEVVLSVIGGKPAWKH